jgi:5-methylcytosine-specific restriction endonuclease McrA
LQEGDHDVQVGSYRPPVLREVKSPRFARRLTLFGWRYHLIVGREPSEASWRSKRHRALHSLQQVEPAAVLTAQGRTYWLFEDRLYWEEDELGPRDVLALVRDRERRHQRKLERAHAALAADAAHLPRRDVIPRAVKQAVWRRDAGRCVDCGSRFDLQYDHVIPFSLGGASTVENLQILCSDCNRDKGASIA